MRYVALVVAVIVAAAAWTGYWYLAAGRLRTGIADWAAAQTANGVEVSYSSIAISGYPFRLHVDIGAPRLAWRQQPGAPEWQTASLTGIAQPWDLRHLLIDLSGRHEVRYQQGGTAHLAVADIGLGQSSYVGDGRGKLQRLSVDLHQVALSIDNKPIGKAARAQLHTRPSQRPGAAADIAVSVDGVDVSKPADLPLGQHIDVVELQFTLVGDIPHGDPQVSIAHWRDDGGIVEVEKLRLDWGKVQADADGTLALDNEMRPLGALTARVRGHGALVDAAVASGQMSPADSKTAKAVLGVLAAAGGGVLSVPVDLQDGTAFLGPVAVARLRPLF